MSRTFSPWCCGDLRVLAGICGRLVRDQRGMARCLGSERRDAIFARTDHGRSQRADLLTLIVSTKAAHIARANVTCVTPLGEAVASTS